MIRERELLGKIGSWAMLAMLLVASLVLVLKTPVVKAIGTIYIRADGSVEGTTYIVSIDNVTYAFTADINNLIVVQKSNIIIDGNGHVLNGSSLGGAGFSLTSVGAVTIKNTRITSFDDAINLSKASNNVIRGNNMDNNMHADVETTVDSNNNIFSDNAIETRRCGIWVMGSNNIVSGNSFTSSANPHDEPYSIILNVGHDNVVTNNNITGNETESKLTAIYVLSSSKNVISGNNIAYCRNGILLYVQSNYGTICENTLRSINSTCFDILGSSDNHIYHNNIISDTLQVKIIRSSNVWDCGYPSGGNYWSDSIGSDLHRGAFQNETGSDGIIDTSFSMYENNTDHYPLTKPYCGTCDVGLRVSPSKTFVAEGYNTTVAIEVTIINYGEQTETLNFTFQMGTTTENQTITLTSRNSTTFIFTWNSAGLAKGSYNMTALVGPVTNETDITDNYYDGEIVRIVMPGNVNGDSGVDSTDLGILGSSWGSFTGDLNYNPNADIDNSGVVDSSDLGIMGAHWGETE
jgi:parallel beta-helix repeat protein